MNRSSERGSMMLLTYKAGCELKLVREFLENIKFACMIIQEPEKRFKILGARTKVMGIKNSVYMLGLGANSE